MATKPKIRVEADVEAAVKGAVKIWAKAEDSAIWGLIREVHKDLSGLPEGKERNTRENALRTYVINGIETEFGEGESKKRAAHISKIFTIARSATPEHFARWKKGGIGFYRAYEEFSKPQQFPAGSKKTEPAKTNGDGGAVGTEKPAGWVSPTQGTEEAVAAQNEDLEDPDREVAQTKTTQSNTKTPIKTGTVAATDPTPNWATKIEQDPSLWDKLITALGKGLSVEMVIAVFESLHRQQHIKMKNVVEQLMQEERFATLVLDFIRDNPTMMPESSESEEEVARTE